MPSDQPKQNVWWGRFALAEGEGGHWEVGPSTLWIYRLAREWRIVHTQQEDPLRDVAQVTIPAPAEEHHLSLDTPSDDTTISRFSFDRTPDAIFLKPVLADRPVIVRPETPLYVTEGEAITLYMSTPVSIRFEAGDPPRLLQERPIHRLSDTWFGPSTREGELCYAARTVGRIRLDDLPRRAHRAITTIHLHNRADDAWLVERVQLPVQHLALYQAADGILWTQALRLERDPDRHLAGLHVENGVPPAVVGATLLTEPRQAARSSLILRTISTLFSKIKEA